MIANAQKDLNLKIRFSKLLSTPTLSKMFPETIVLFQSYISVGNVVFASGCTEKPIDLGIIGQIPVTSYILLLLGFRLMSWDPSHSSLFYCLENTFASIVVNSLPSSSWDAWRNGWMPVLGYIWHERQFMTVTGISLGGVSSKSH